MIIDIDIVIYIYPGDLGLPARRQINHVLHPNLKSEIARESSRFLHASSSWWLPRCVYVSRQEPRSYSGNPHQSRRKVRRSLMESSDEDTNVSMLQLRPDT